ncbi:DoxX family protein [Anaeromyxobacter sp. SG17]|uniref:DoxX family protein n=1 Tax=Anaeromyxobacter sp. SG17 TaxID=2925405 RepID=UPI001F597D2C|nr:MauE/DoxX family redox-associated membrane protein [Anaeromyxobacter sp. SG17]
MKRLLALLRIGLGATFLYAAATKLPDMAAFAENLANYRLVPPGLVPGAAASVIGIELALGLLLVTGRLARGAALVATGLLAVFTLGLSQALLRGIDLRCGCFGGNESATWLTVLRDAGMLAVALALLLRGPGRLLPARPAPASEPRRDASAATHG